MKQPTKYTRILIFVISIKEDFDEIVFIRHAISRESVFRDRCEYNPWGSLLVGQKGHCPPPNLKLNFIMRLAHSLNF